MPTKKLYALSLAAVLCCCAAVFAAFCVFGKMHLPLAAGFLVGTVSAAIGHALFFKAWQSAPNGAKVALFYISRVIVIVCTVLAALAFSEQAALGAIIPQLFPVPVLAVIMALSKE